MSLYISVIAAALIALSAWLIFSVKKVKKRPRYTTDEQRKSFSDTDKMLEHIKEGPPQAELPNEDVKKEVRKKKRRRQPTQKKRRILRKVSSDSSNSFELEDAIMEAQLLERKSIYKENRKL